jgi:hypothetical protein
MAINPSFIATPKFSSISTGTAAVTSTEPATASVQVVLTMAAAGRVDSVFIRYLGNNTQSTVMRFFVYTGSGTQSLVHEESLPALTTVSNTLANQYVVWRPNIVLPSAATLGVTIGTAVSNGFRVSAEYGEY